MGKYYPIIFVALYGLFFTTGIFLFIHSNDISRIESHVYELRKSDSKKWHEMRDLVNRIERIEKRG